jgi:hypothetical protein
MPTATNSDIQTSKQLSANNPLIEFLEDTETQVITALYRPAKPQLIKMPKVMANSGALNKAQRNQLETQVTQHLIDSVWTTQFKFHASWLEDKVIQARPVRWGLVSEDNHDAHGSFECHAAKQSSALVLVYTNAVDHDADLPLAFATGQVTMRVVVVLGEKPALLSVSVHSLGALNLKQPAPKNTIALLNAIEQQLKTLSNAKTNRTMLSVVASKATDVGGSTDSDKADQLLEQYEWRSRFVEPYFVQEPSATDPNHRVLAIKYVNHVGPSGTSLLSTSANSALLVAANVTDLRARKYTPHLKLQRTVSKQSELLDQEVQLKAKHFYVEQGGYGQAEFSKPLTNQPIVLPKGQTLPIFSSAMAAVNLWNHGDAFFARLEQAGFDAIDYFKFAQLPLALAVRAPIVPGPGHAGQTVNAQAMMVKPNEIVGDTRPNIEVRFAHGNLSIRRSSATSGRPDYLSAAIDSRWAWHEFGHVLLGASTHHMELPFCHGICDALVAIVHDQGANKDAHPGARGVTFPWLPTGRRHDRTVAQGWSWMGPMHRCSVYTKRDLAMSPKGYKTEQIMSTTLFNLHLSLSGNSAKKAQIEQSKTTVLGLIFHTLALAGSAELVPIRTPKQFLALMLDADQLRNNGKHQSAILKSFASQGLV